MSSKLIAALIVASVLAIAVVGLVAAQAASTSTPNGTTRTVSSAGFFGWMGRCLGFRGTYNNAAQAPAYVGQPDNIITNPNTGTSTTYQGYYGYGPCSGMMGLRP